MRTRFVNLRIPNVDNQTERAEILVMDASNVDLVVGTAHQR